MDISIVLGIMVVPLSLCAFAIYNKQVFRGESHPNVVSWALWAFLASLNFFSYLKMSGDWIKSLLPIANSAACFATFGFILWKRKFSKLSEADKKDKLSETDKKSLKFGFVALFVWWWLQSATYANVILQIGLFISHVPTIVGVWKDPSREKASPWFIWTASRVVAAVVIMLRWQGQYQDFLYPLNVFMLDGTVAVLSLRKAKPSHILKQQ